VNGGYQYHYNISVENTGNVYAFNVGNGLNFYIYDVYAGNYTYQYGYYIKLGNILPSGIANREGITTIRWASAGDNIYSVLNGNPTSNRLYYTIQ